MGATARPLPPLPLVVVAIVTATHSRPMKSKPNQTDAQKALCRANYRSVELAIIPAPQGLVRFPPTDLLAHTPQPLNWADTTTLKAITACRLLYASYRGTTWNCSHLVQLAETHKHLKALTLGIPVQAPFAPTMSPHHDALVSSLRTLVDIIMLRRPELSPDLAPLAKHICETAATDSGHFVAVLSGVYLSLLTGRKALNIQGVFGAGKTRSVTLLMVWIAFSTEAKIIFLSKENPAGRAVEDLMEYFGSLIPSLKHKLSRILSAQESERYKHEKRPLNWRSRPSLSCYHRASVEQQRQLQKPCPPTSTRSRNYSGGRGAANAGCQNYPLLISCWCSQPVAASRRWTASSGGYWGWSRPQTLRGPLLFELSLVNTTDRHMPSHE